MAGNYQKDLFKQLEETMQKVDSLFIENKELKLKISSLESNHRKEIRTLESKMEQREKEHSKEIARLEGEVSTLKIENKKLRDQINKDSSNSSKPPSSNGFKSIPNSREKTGRKPGGQVGHKGHHLSLFPVPTNVVDHKKNCSCGGNVNYTKFTAKQLVDIEVITHIIEHRAYSGTCNCCGKAVRNEFPEQLKNPVTYGEVLKSISTLLVLEGAVSINRTAQMIEELTGGAIQLSHGTITNFTKELSKSLEPAVEQIKKKLFSSPVLNKDETGIKINGKLNWFHVTSNPNYTFYHADTHRGKEADLAIAILNDYSGALMHDHWKTLYHFNCDHAECNAHALRYLKGVIQNQDRAWASDMVSLLVEAHRKRNQLKANEAISFSVDETEDYFKRFDLIIERGKHEFLADPNFKEGYNGEDMKLLRRLDEYKKEHLRFITDFNVPFDNNLAERDLRMVKAKTKISGGFRSDYGAKYFANIKSYLSTMRKNKLNLFQGIKDAFLSAPVFM